MQTTRLSLCWLAGTAILTGAPPASEAASCIPGFDYAIFAQSSIQIQGASSTDAWNSSSGTYAQTVSCSPGNDGDIGSNATSSGMIQLQANSTKVCGDVFVGAGGNPSSVVQQQNATVTGTKQAQTTNTVLSNVTAPTLTSGSPASPSFQNTNATLTTNRKYDDVTCQNGSLTLGAGRYVVKTLTLQANCQLKVTSGPVEVYFTDKLQLQGGAIANTTGIPSNIMFYGTSTAGSVQVQGGANAFFAVYAPQASCQVQGNADVYGAIVCKDAQVQGNGKVHYDKALRNASGGGFACTTNEVSRGTPIAATISNQSCIVQGTYEPATGAAKTIAATTDVATFEFPYIKGHVRARVATSITTSASTFSSGTIVFDGANAIPTVQVGGCALGTNSSFTTNCRNVFTNINSTPASGTTTFAGTPLSRITRFDNTTANATAIGQLIAPTGTGANQVPNIGVTEWKTIVSRVLAGTSNGTVAKLGGVDRSTVAVIGPSTLAGATTRPTMIYFGGADGMLHAACASTNGTTASASNICPSTLAGTELWAFMPRVQLPLVRVNKQRVDGSVRVVDAFGDFPDPTTGATNGTKSWRTILTFQTGYSEGNYGSKPAVYAIDITDPAKPILLWEHTTPSTTGPQLGTGLAMHAGPSIVSGEIMNLAVAQTNNGGSGGAGMVVNALQLETGVAQWTSPFSHIYTSPRPSSSAYDGAIPATGIPGGTVGVDLASSGFTSHVVMGDLYGNLWKLDVSTGTSATKLFSYSTDKHPIGALPAILDNGTKIAVFGTGGYADPSGNSMWTTTGQRLIGVKLTGSTTLDESASSLAFSKPLGTNEKISAQVLVIGTEVFIATDTAEINSSTYGTNSATTGAAYNFDFAVQSPAITLIDTLQGGASSFAAYQNGSTYTLVGGAADKTEQLSDTGTTGGITVDYQKSPKPTRLAWVAARR